MAYHAVSKKERTRHKTERSSFARRSSKKYNKVHKTGLASPKTTGLILPHTWRTRKIFTDSACSQESLSTVSRLFSLREATDPCESFTWMHSLWSFISNGKVGGLRDDKHVPLMTLCLLKLTGSLPKMIPSHSVWCSFWAENAFSGEMYSTLQFGGWILMFLLRRWWSSRIILWPSFPTSLQCVHQYLLYLSLLWRISCTEHYVLSWCLLHWLVKLVLRVSH